MQTDVVTDAFLMGAVLILWLTLVYVFAKAALRKLREGNILMCILLVAGVAIATGVFSNSLLWSGEGLLCLMESRTTGYCRL